MKQHLFILIAFLTLSFFYQAQAQNNKQDEKKTHTIPKPIGSVSDYEKLFSDAQKQELIKMITDIEKKTTIEVAVVTIRKDQTTKSNFENFTFELANQWGIGKKNKNNGILIGISAGLKTIRINIGSGLEKNLPDKKVKSIIDIILPYCKKGNYYKAINQSIKEIEKNI